MALKKQLMMNLENEGLQEENSNSREFDRKIYIIKNMAKDPKNYQRAVTIPMDVTRRLGLENHDEVTIIIRKKEDERLY